MRRREFVTLVGSAVAWPLAARAQQPAMPVIGFISPATSAEQIRDLLAAFRLGLAETGYVEGKNVAIEYRFTNWRPELMADAAADLVRRNVHIIFAPTPEASAAVKMQRLPFPSLR